MLRSAADVGGQLSHGPYGASDGLLLSEFVKSANHPRISSAARVNINSNRFPVASSSP